MKLTDKLYEALENPADKHFSRVNDFLAFLVLLSVLSISLESVASLEKYQRIFLSIEYLTVFFFTLEYIVRLAKKRAAYAFSFFGFIDLISVLPSLLGLGNFTFLKSVRVLRILRFLRVLRLAKLSRQIKDKALREQEKAAAEKLKVEIYFFSLFFAIILFGFLMYAAEGYRAQFANVFLAALWASKVILGGVSQHMPETIFGEIITVSARFVGLLLFGLLIAVVGSFVNNVLFGREEK